MNHEFDFANRNRESYSYRPTAFKQAFIVQYVWRSVILGYTQPKFTGHGHGTSVKHKHQSAMGLG